jgi:hypothetical protein
MRVAPDQDIKLRAIRSNSKIDSARLDLRRVMEAPDEGQVTGDAVHDLQRTIRTSSINHDDAGSWIAGNLASKRPKERLDTAGLIESGHYDEEPDDHSDLSGLNSHHSAFSTIAAPGDQQESFQPHRPIWSQT